MTKYAGKNKMTNYLGQQTGHNPINKSESHKLHQTFPVPSRGGTITFSADLVASDSLTVTVNGETTATVTYGSSHAATMTALAAAIALLTTVISATVSAAREITIVPVDDEHPISITNVNVTHAGAGTAIVTTAAVPTKIYAGQPVKLDANGYVVPAASGENPTNVIGIAIEELEDQGEVTVMMKAYAIVRGISDGDTVPGPVKYTGVDATTGFCKYSDSSVTYADQAGWALEIAADKEEFAVAVLF